MHFILLLGIGMAIPNCLSLALNQYGDVLGTAGAIFGLLLHCRQPDYQRHEPSSQWLVNHNALVFSWAWGCHGLREQEVAGYTLR